MSGTAVLSKKADNKVALQSLVGLPEDRDVPFWSCDQTGQSKGPGSANYIMDELMGEDLQMVVLGTGDRTYEDALLFRVQVSFQACGQDNV